MAWIIQPVQLADENGKPTNKWRLLAMSDEISDYYELCDHKHDSPQEAIDCEDAQKKKKSLGTAIGGPT